MVVLDLKERQISQDAKIQRCRFRTGLVGYRPKGLGLNMGESTYREEQDERSCMWYPSPEESKKMASACYWHSWVEMQCHNWLLRSPLTHLGRGNLI